MLVVACLALGGLIGEILNIEGLFERFGEWLKQKTGNAKDQGFVHGFVTASLTVCIGAMAIMGAIQDGISGDWSTLGAKAILDLIIVMVMTCSMGKGCVFSAIPVFLWEGSLTLLAAASCYHPQGQPPSERGKHLECHTSQRNPLDEMHM